MRRLALLAALALAGCGSAASRPLTCGHGKAAYWIHIELFDHGRVVLLPPGIGIRGGRRAGAYVHGGRCRYPLWTDEPTGLVAVDGPGRRLGDLFRVWGQPLTRERVWRARGPVRVAVGGAPFTGPPASVPLTRHAQIVLQVGGPLVRPHSTYRFPHLGPMNRE